jgi:hypothetical protein
MSSPEELSEYDMSGVDGVVPADTSVVMVYYYP